jgi:hypothetical protein
LDEVQNTSHGENKIQFGKYSLPYLYIHEINKEYILNSAPQQNKGKVMDSPSLEVDFSESEMKIEL